MSSVLIPFPMAILGLPLLVPTDFLEPHQFTAQLETAPMFRVIVG